MYQTGNVDNFSDMNDKIIDENNEEYIKTKGAFIPYENLNNLTPRQKVLLWTLYFDCNLCWYAPYEIELKTKTFNLERGQIFITRKKLSKLTGFPKRELRYLIKQLIDKNIIAAETKHNATLITIINYKKYHSKPDSSNY